jgi:hypothetical protein
MGRRVPAGATAIWLRRRICGGTVEHLDQRAPLVIKAVSEFRSDNQIAYRFEISASGVGLLDGRASVLLGALIGRTD